MTSLLERYSIDELHELIDLATDEEAAILASGLQEELFDWSEIGREKQQPPEGEWLYWVLVTGRRWGKTRTAAEWLRKRALATRGAYAICAPTYADVRDVCVEQGIREDWRKRSGFLSVCKPEEIETYNRSLGEITLSNGSKIKMLSADEPERARGWGFHAAWCDEFSSWRRPATWYETLLPATTMADSHRFVITTTPKRNELTRMILKRAEDEPETVRLVIGRTGENEANLGAGAVDELRRSMSARLARQEIEGELIDDVEGALWSANLIQTHRVPTDTEVDFATKGSRIVVAVDPAVSVGENADLTGIVIAGRIGNEAWVLGDASDQYPAVEAMRRAVEEYRYFDANEIVIERNNGGDYLPALLHTIDPSVPVKTVVATRGKAVRAEPIAGLYERGLVHHIGDFPELEDQMTTWTPLDPSSPDRLDALVWALTALFPDLPKGLGRGMRYRGAA